MERRHVLFLLAAVPALAAASEPTDVFGVMASSLAEHDASGFIQQFDPAMPKLDTLRADAEALAAQSDVISSIDFLGRKEDGGDVILSVDWAMTLQSRDAPGGPTERRRRILTVRLRPFRGEWRVVSLDPLEFFRPPHF